MKSNKNFAICITKQYQTTEQSVLMFWRKMKKHIIEFVAMRGFKNINPYIGNWLILNLIERTLHSSILYWFCMPVLYNIFTTLSIGNLIFFWFFFGEHFLIYFVSSTKTIDGYQARYNNIMPRKIIVNGILASPIYFI